MASTYSLDQFRDHYLLKTEEAERIYRISGPARADLDALMLARARRANAEGWALDPYSMPLAEARQTRKG